tara:strand:+ start:224 stop:748 length:525 start_codon:yes stop_codon:yes gene_type:complete
MASDISWIKEFESSEKEYKDFYSEPVESIQLLLLYVSKQNSLFHIKKDTAILENSCLSKDSLIDILQTYMIHNQKKYRPISMLKYNIHLEPEEVELYIKEDNDNDFLSVEKSIDSIYFEDSIALFQNLNCLYIIFHENCKSWQNKTKKIYIRDIKKRRNQKKHRKTKSKQLKVK